jgi:hypothetical protein
MGKVLGWLAVAGLAAYFYSEYKKAKKIKVTVN